MNSVFAVWTGVILAFPAGVSPGVGTDGTVTGLQVLPSADRTEIVVAVEGLVETRDFTMQAPSRVVLDLLDTRSSLPGGYFEGVARGGVRHIRATQYSDDVVRIVLEVDELTGYSVVTGPGYVRISMENPWGTFEPWSVEATGSNPLDGVGGSGGVAAVGSAPTAVVPVSETQVVQAERISVNFSNTPIREVLFTFADFADRTIVAGSQVTGNVTQEIRNQPWDIALIAILESHGLAAQEQASGIIRVDRMEDLVSREQLEPLLTRPFRVNFAGAQELLPAVETLLSPRGQVSASESTNNLVVTDIPRVLDAVEQLLQGLDLQTPEITISAKIMFVNRTDLQEFGVVYDLKDSRGNQLNQVTPGGIDTDGDGRITEDEFVDIGTNVISLGGNSIAALGNANQRVVGPSLRFLTTLIVGRHTLVSFVEALQSVNLSDVQAAPQVRVLDNQQARILVGERTPIRVLDAGGVAPGQPGGQFAQATVQIEETGIILEVTPHVTAGDLIWMDLRAERSGIEIAEADLGFIFNTQEANTRVLVADGETVVIGGLTVTERTEVRAGIPLLQNLPLMGRFFRLTREQRVQRDLMILVTPQINRR